MTGSGQAEANRRAARRERALLRGATLGGVSVMLAWMAGAWLLAGYQDFLPPDDRQRILVAGGLGALAGAGLGFRIARRLQGTRRRSALLAAALFCVVLHGSARHLLRTGGGGPDAIWVALLSAGSFFCLGLLIQGLGLRRDGPVKADPVSDSRARSGTDRRD